MSSAICRIFVCLILKVLCASEAVVNGEDKRALSMAISPVQCSSERPSKGYSEMRKSWLVRGIEAGERARHRMQLTGLSPNGHTLWQAWEQSPLEVLGPAHTIVGPMLEQRSDLARYSKASRMGVAFKRRSLSEVQARSLKRLYPKASHAELLAAFPGWTIEALRAAANRRGYKRAPKPFEPTGIRILDQILQRAESRNHTLQDLDAYGGCKGYFTRRLWRKKPSHVVHCHTVRNMGGTVRAAFA